MKVLFFAGSRPNFGNSASGNNSGGWTGMLLRGLAARPGMEIGVAYLSKEHSKATTENGIRFYPITTNASHFAKIHSVFSRSWSDEKALLAGEMVCRDFAPDIIEVFGCAESPFGLLSERIDIPLVIHIQGIMSACRNAWFPPGVGKFECLARCMFHPRRIVQMLISWAYVAHAVRRERRILRNCRHLIGRSDWDRRCMALMAPKAQYYICHEIARSVFYSPPVRSLSNRPLFVSTIGSPLYKGHDMILKTADTLVRSGFSDFEWKVFGVDQIRMAEVATGVRARDVNVTLFGKATAEQVRSALMTATAYIHPSYIENSSAAICEAQLADVPVVATDVGGNPSFVFDSCSTMLVPANDPFSMAWAMRKLATSGPSSQLGGLEQARIEHDPETIISKTIDIFESILNGTEARIQPSETISDKK